MYLQGSNPEDTDIDTRENPMHLYSRPKTDILFINFPTDQLWIRMSAHTSLSIRNSIRSIAIHGRAFGQNWMTTNQSNITDGNPRSRRHVFAASRTMIRRVR